MSQAIPHQPVEPDPHTLLSNPIQEQSVFQCQIFAVSFVVSQESQTVNICLPSCGEPALYAHCDATVL